MSELEYEDVLSKGFGKVDVCPDMYLKRPTPKVTPSVVNGSEPSVIISDLLRVSAQ